MVPLKMWQCLHQSEKNNKSVYVKFELKIDSLIYWTNRVWFYLQSSTRNSTRALKFGAQAEDGHI